MNVVHLNTNQTAGGAAVAAGRVHQALLRSGVGSTLLVGASTRQDAGTPAAGTPAAPGVVRLAGHSMLANAMAFGRFVGERLYFLPHERDESVRFHLSPARFGVDLTYNNLIRQADVINLHWINYGFLSVSSLGSLLRLGKPVVWTMHDMWPFTGGCHYSRGCDHYVSHCRLCPYLRDPGERDLSYNVFERKRRAYASGSLTLVSPSGWLAGLAGQSALLGNVVTHVIPNPLDLTQYQPVEPASARAQLGLPADKPLLLFGSFNIGDVRKGFRYFADALHRLHAQQPDLSPEIVVFGKDRPEAFGQLPYPVRRLGVLTTDAQLTAAYSAADALVVPSLEDNLPNTVAEALACGTPVVAFRTGGIPEMIAHRQTGFLADVRSTDQLAEGLHYVLTHPNPALLRSAARLSAEAQFAEAHVAGRYIELYQHLLNA